MTKTMSLCSAGLILLASGLAGQPPAKPVAFTGHAAGVVALRFSPDGKAVVSVSPKDLCRWDSATGKKLMGSDTPTGGVVAIGPDGAEGPTLAILRSAPGSGDRVGLRLATGGKDLHTIDPRDGEAQDHTRKAAFRARIAALTLSPDGKLLITGGSSPTIGGPHGWNGGAVRLWDAASGKPVRMFGEVRQWDKNSIDKTPPPGAEIIPGVSTSTFAGAVALSADGKYVVAGTDGVGGELPKSGEVWVWSANDGKLVRKFKARDEVEAGEVQSSVSALAPSPDNTFVAAAVGTRGARGDGLIVKEGPASAIRVWNLATGKAVHTLKAHKNSITGLAFSPDGKRLASIGGDRSVKLWDAATGQEVAGFTFDVPQLNAVAFSPDGRRVAVGGGDANSGEVRVWECPKE